MLAGVASFEEGIKVTHLQILQERMIFFKELLWLPCLIIRITKHICMAFPNQAKSILHFWLRCARSFEDDNVKPAPTILVFKIYHALVMRFGH